MSLTHFVITSFFFCCSSCCRIESFTLSSGVVVGGLTAESAWITCHPYCVCTGRDSSPFFSENAVLSNGATVWPRTIVSLPPFAAELGSFEYFFASFAKFFSCAATSWL